MTPVRVVMVDDHEIVRAGISALLGKEPDLHIVGTASTGEEALDLIAALKPDVAVVDYSLPRMSGIEVCEEVARRNPATAVIILTAYSHDDVVLRSLDAGARGYVCKDISASELKKAIRSVARGEPAFDPKVTARVLHWAHRRSNGHGPHGLSVREVEALRLVAVGATNRDIAHRMHVSENTVKTYLRRALEKLDCRSRGEAAVVAARKGLL